MFLKINEQEEILLKKSLKTITDFSNAEIPLFNYKNDDLELVCNIVIQDNKKNVCFILYDKKNVAVSFFVELTTKYKEEHSFFYKDLGTGNVMFFKKDLESYIINEKDSKNYIVVKDSMVESFKNLKLKTDKCRQIFDLLNMPIENIKDFIKPINENNFNKYVDVIKNNKGRLEDVLILDRESRNLGFDFMNLTKENRDMLLLKEDISITLNGKKSIFNIFKK